MREPEGTPHPEGASIPVEEVLAYLRGGQDALYEVVRTYGRTLSPEEHWWLGVCLAATVLAELSEVSHVVRQVGLLSERIGTRGATPEVVEELIAELAKIDSLGLLWPVYERDQGQWRRAEVAIAPDFGPEAAYWLAVAHLGAALLVREGRSGEIPDLAATIGDLVTGGLRPEHRERILAVFRKSGGAGGGSGALE
ncbi:MAG: hypothetical protein L6E13_07190 [Firmicutes bacterium]|nr:hypothetical protein [Bacillota bacterium]